MEAEEEEERACSPAQAGAEEAGCTHTGGDAFALPCATRILHLLCLSPLYERRGEEKEKENFAHTPAHTPLHLPPSEKHALPLGTPSFSAYYCPMPAYLSFFAETDSVNLLPHTTFQQNEHV